ASVAPATAPAPTAAPSKNARRASSCLVIYDSSRDALLTAGWSGRALRVPGLFSCPRGQLCLQSVSRPRTSALAPDEHSSWNTQGWPAEEIEQRMTSPDGRPPRLRLRPSGAAGKHQFAPFALSLRLQRFRAAPRTGRSLCARMRVNRLHEVGRAHASPGTTRVHHAARRGGSDTMERSISILSATQEVSVKTILSLFAFGLLSLIPASLT